jgi:uncharacterized damage-inducible protein DinB
MIQNPPVAKPFSLHSAACELVTFNSWANQRLAGWLNTKPEAILDTPAVSSFPSIRATITHIWYTENAWLSWLRGEKPTKPYGQSFTGERDELFSGWTGQSKIFEEFVYSLTEEAVAGNCSFKAPIRWPEYDDFEKPVFDLILHAMNHSTYHRGQIITMARTLGITDPPMTDFIFWLLRK